MEDSGLIGPQREPWWPEDRYEDWPSWCAGPEYWLNVDPLCREIPEFYRKLEEDEGEFN